MIGHSSWISAVSITTDCTTIISGSNDTNVKLWSATGNKYSQNIATPSDHIIHHATQPECVAITTDGRWGLSGAKNDSLKLWDISSARCLKSTESSVACIATMHNLARGAQAVTGSHNGEITVWHCEDLTPQQVVKGHDGGITSLHVSRDDSFVVSASSDKKVGVCHLFGGGGGHMEHLTGHSDAVMCVSLMSGDVHAISGSKDATVRQWNVQTMSCERVFEGHKGPVGCVASTSDNTAIVSGSGDFTINVWSVETGECINTLEGHHDTIKCIGITQDDQYAIAGSHEGKGQLRLWDIKTGSCACVFEGHSHAVMNLRVLPHQLVVTSSRDGTIKVWNILNGQLLNSFDFQSQVKYFAIQPAQSDGYSVILVTKSGTVSILKLYLPRSSSVDSSTSKEFVFSVLNGDGSSETTRSKDGKQCRCSFCICSQCCLNCQTCRHCTVV